MSKLKPSCVFFLFLPGFVYITIHAFAQNYTFPHGKRRTAFFATSILDSYKEDNIAAFHKVQLFLSHMERRVEFRPNALLETLHQPRGISHFIKSLLRRLSPKL